MANFSVSKRGVRNVLIGLIMMIAGFILMMGGGSADPNVFDTQMFSVTRTVVAPVVILLGITVIIIGIMKKPKEE